jgi:hypothetical protein
MWHTGCKAFCSLCTFRYMRLSYLSVSILKRVNSLILRSICVSAIRPNVVVETLILLLRIREVSVLNLVLETGYPV